MLEDLKQLLATDPFQPFRIVMASGKEYIVTSPYQVALGKSQINFYQAGSDDWSVLRLNQVVSFDVFVPAEA